MAESDTNDVVSNKTDVDSLRTDLERQIADLRSEVGRLSASIAERGEALYEGAKDEASELYANAATRARGAARQVKTQTHAVSEAIRENPGTAATVLSSAGLLFFLVGLMVGQALSDNNRGRRWY
jgi:ElaB/YqjD/DUF883 family membrane-anchored ribosome-binding protein